MRRLAWAIAACYAVGLALLVFTPIARQLNDLTVQLYLVWVYHLHLPPEVTPPVFGAALNVLLFIPLGVLAVLLVRWPWWAATLLALWVSAGIELVQAIPFMQRQASLEDVITNSIGGLIGSTVELWLRSRRERRPE